MMDNIRLYSNSFVLLFLVCTLSRQVIALSKLYVGDNCFTWTSFPIDYDIDSPVFDESSSKIIESSRYGGYTGGLNCTLRFKPGGDGLILTVQKIDFRAFCTDSIKIENSQGIQLDTLCNNAYIPSEGKSYYSSGTMTIRYKTGSGYVSSIYKGFRMVVTTYRTTPCFSDEFRCDNFKCIYDGFVCDGNNHCGDNSDQNSCVGRMRVGSFVGLFFGIFFIVVVFSTLGVCIRRRRRTTTIGTVMTSPAAVPPPPYGAQYPPPTYGAQHPPPQFVTQYAPPTQQASPSYQGVNPGYQTEQVNPLYK